jgi:cytochrome c oxidase assembly factor CtaG
VTTLPPLTVERFFTTWRFDGWVAAAVGVTMLAYLGGVYAASRRGVRWPLRHTMWFGLLGLGMIVVATMSSLVVYASVLLWPMAVMVAVLLTIVPIGLGLGDPVGLVSAALAPSAAARWHRILHNPVFRVFTFPLVSPLLAIVTEFVVFFTGYIGAAMGNTSVLHVLELQLVVTGSLFALPMLGVEALPAWCSQPVRMTIAAVDGLLDAIPGIVIMTSTSLVAAGFYRTANPSYWGPSAHWDQVIAGGLLVTIAEVVAVPFVAILFLAWIREDATQAKEIDRALDLEDLRRPANADGSDPSPATRPWWEVDPGPLADRAGRYGWKDDGSTR